MALSQIEKQDVMETVVSELENMFSRLSNHYGRADLSKHALLLPKIEAHIKASLLEMVEPSAPVLVD